MIATGICGSDFHGYSGENGRRHPGQVMGHETVGRIDELGSGVAELAVGQLVTVNPVMSCGMCCRPACHGQQQWCTRRVVLGVAPEISAAFADRVAVPAANIVPLPEDMPEELGALGGAAWRSATTRYAAVMPRPEDRVLVIGGGPIGQACLLAARRLGVSTCLVRCQPSRRDLCARLGARSSTRPSATCRRRWQSGSAVRPRLVVDAVGVNRDCGRRDGGIRTWGAGSYWSVWARRSWSSLRTLSAPRSER